MGRPPAWVVLLPLLVGVLALALFLASGPRSEFDVAVDTLGDDSLFSTSRAAAESFLAVGEHLGEAGRRCVRDESRASPRCSALLAGAGYTQTAALRVVDCTRPGVFEARRAAIDHLDDLRTFAESETRTTPPGPPSLPRC